MARRKGSSQSLSFLWKELTQTRLDWAYRAYEDFLASLDERVRGCFAGHGAEASVVLFGRTQVGKTTLLLNILGVAEQHLRHVGQILRGGRASGQSATATAMQYQRSADDEWHIRINETWDAMGEQQLLELLGNVRIQVESGSHAFDDPIQIAIPARFFCDETQPRPAVRILDLPGDNPKDLTEAAHVRHVAERYIPIADLVLIVGRLDDLSFLNPNALSLPGIRDWRYAPSRFRVITTFSFSLDSESSWANRQDQLDLDSIRAHLIEEIETHGITLGQEARDLSLYFPLDFGDSWRQLREYDQARYEKIVPYNRAFMEMLLHDISESATVHGRIRQAARTHIIAARIKEEELGQMSVLEAQLHKDAQKVRADAKVAEGLVKKSENELQNCLNIEFSSEDEGALRDEAGSSVHYGSAEVDGVGTNTKYFFQLINSCCAYLVRKAINFEPELESDFEGVCNPVEAKISVVKRDIEGCFDDLRYKLAAYNVDEYYPSISDAYYVDVADLKSAIKSANKKAAKRVAEMWIKAICDYIEANGEKRAEFARKLSGHKLAYSNCCEKLRIVEELVYEHKKAALQFAQDMDADIQRGYEYFRLLHSACNDELLRRKDRMQAAATPGRRMLELLGAIAVCNEKDKLLTGT